MGKLREIGLRTRLAVGLALLACALGVPATAAAAPPNDDFAGATPIASLPYTNTVSSVETATFESGDPYLYCRRGQVAGDNSVWYRYTTGPGVERLKLTTDSATTNYDSVIQVFAGSRNGADMALGGCADDPSSSTGGDTAVVRAEPNTTYYIEVAAKATLGSPSALKLDVAAAPVYQVTGGGDGAGSCASNVCPTLRAAVAQSNTAPGAILLGPGTFTLSTPIGTETAGGADNTKGDLDFTSTSLVEGTGSAKAVIDAGGQDRDLQVLSPATLALRNVKLAGGVAGGPTLPAGASGGSIDVLDGALDADHVELNGGHADHGGNLSIELRSFRVQHSALTDGQATGTTGQGGNVFVGPSARNTLIARSAITGGQAAGGGGVLANGPTQLINATISGNTATGSADGGGVLKVPGSSFTVADSTLAGNMAGGSGGGLRLATSGTTVSQSIIADNSAPTDPDCSAASGYVQAWNILEQAGTCTGAGTTDTTGTDPGLRGPGLYGNETTIDPPQPGSVAIDKVASGFFCPLTNIGESVRFNTDQRDLPRPVDGGTGVAKCDSGAVEVQPPACQNTALTTLQNTPGSVALPCADPDGDPIDSLVLDANPQHGALSGSGLSSRTYTPNPGYLGADTFTFHVTSGTLASNVASAAITVSAPPPPSPGPTGPPGPPGPPATKDVIAPTLRKLTVTSSRGRFTASFASNEAGRFTALLTRAAPGVRRGRRCVAPPRRSTRRARRCTRRLKVKSLGGAAKNGTNRVALGRLGPNVYRLQIVVTDGAGNKSRALIGTFRVRAKKR